MAHRGQTVCLRRRWLYCALGTQEALEANGAAPERFRVLHKRPTDLAARTDMGAPANVVVADMLLDDGACVHYAWMGLDGMGSSRGYPLPRRPHHAAWPGGDGDERRDDRVVLCRLL